MRRGVTAPCLTTIILNFTALRRASVRILWANWWTMPGTKMKLHELRRGRPRRARASWPARRLSRQDSAWFFFNLAACNTLGIPSKQRDKEALAHGTRLVRRLVHRKILISDLKKHRRQLPRCPRPTQPVAASQGALLYRSKNSAYVAQRINHRQKCLSWMQ